MKRISRHELQTVVSTLNTIEKFSVIPYDMEGVAQPGHFHLNIAYGGYALHQFGNGKGGCRDVFNRGHMPARELLMLLRAYMQGAAEARSGGLAPFQWHTE